MEPSDSANPVEHIYWTENGHKRKVTGDLDRIQTDEMEVEDSLTTTDFVTTSDGTILAVLVSAPDQLDKGPIASGETATIWAGAYDDSGIAPKGITNKTLNVTVTQPDGTQETFTETTDSNGRISITYDLSQAGRGDGSYKVMVTDQDGHSTSSNFRVGKTIVSTSNTDGVMFTGEQSEFAFLVVDGASGASGVSITLRVTNSSGTVKEETKQTDADGFAKIAFTPSNLDNYTIQAELDNANALQTATVSAQDMVVGGAFDLMEAVVGHTSSYGGYLQSSAGNVANTDLVVKFFTDFSKTNLFLERSVTTDEGGFFLFDYDIPADFQEDRLYISAENANGDRIPVEFDDIDVDEPNKGFIDGGGGGGSDVTLSESTDFSYAPGEQVTVDITATDDGNPITQQSIEVFLRFDFNGPPVYSTTVTTDDQGEASASFQLPTNAPDGFRLEGIIAMEYNGETYTDSIQSNVVKYNIIFDPPFNLKPGGSGTYSIQVIDPVTQDGVEGIPVHIDAIYNGKAGSFGTAKLVSGSDGTDEVTLSTPGDIRFNAAVNYIHRYRSFTFAREISTDLPGALTEQSGETFDAGGDTTLSFDVADNVTLHGLVFGETDFAADRSFGTQFQGPGTFTLSIPELFPEGDSFSLTAWAVDGQGNIYRSRQRFQIDSGVIFLDAAGEQNVSSGGEATVSIYAQQVDQLKIEKLWTDWSLAADNPDGGTVNPDISATGTVTFDYNSIEGDVSSALKVSLPSDYVGGTYLVDVVATNSNGDSLETTASIQLQ